MTAGNHRPMDVVLISGSSLFANQIRQVLKRIRKCQIEVKNSVYTALQFLIEHKPDLILADWQLGQLDASELLQALRASDDWKTIPTILCLDSSSEQRINQVQSLGVSHVIVKPVSQNTLSRILAELLPITKHSDSEHKLLGYKEIRKKLNSISTLTPLPELVNKIMEIFRDPNSSARDLAEEIKKDQVITAKILRIVNSAYYGFHREIGNVDHAIVVLGFEEVMNIAQAVCLMNAFDFPSNNYFNREKFWLHALGTAYIAKALSRQTNKVIQKDAFVIGLLHDFGKVIFNQHFPEIFRDIIKKASEQNRSLHHVCRDSTTIDHAEIGGLVAESWKLPESLVNAITYHHQPGRAPRNGDEVHLAHIANILCHTYGIGGSGNPVVDPPHYSSLDAFGIGDTNLDEVWKTLKIDPDSIKGIFR